MKFLSKLLEYLGKGAQLIGMFQPIISQENAKAGVIVQTISKDFAEGMNAIADAEKIGAALKLTGTDKLKVAIPLMGDVILNSAALANHSIANIDLYNQGLAKFTDGMADIANSLDPKGLVVVNKAS